MRIAKASPYCDRGCLFDCMPRIVSDPQGLKDEWTEGLCKLHESLCNSRTDGMCMIVLVVSQPQISFIQHQRYTDQ
jgi:hypothetical protein